MTAQYRPYRDEEVLDALDSETLAWADHEPGTIQIYGKTTESLPFTSNRRLLCGCVMLSLFTLLAGFLIGYFSHSQHSECVPNLAVALHSVRDENPFIRGKIITNINEDSIKSVTRQFSSEPHMAGSANDLKLATQVKTLLHEYGFDKIKVKNYTVLLSFPDDKNPNFVQLVDNDDKRNVLYSSLSEEKSSSDSPSAFCAYSPKADLTGDVIFVNYGRLSDYQILQNVYNITRETFVDKILIAKQFHLTADEQMTFAHQMGASALLLYPDPEHYNPPQFNATPFPGSVWMPPDAIRRDSLLWNGIGDPQTPGYPATHYAYRLPLKSAQLPNIPVQPISYSTAYEILRQLGGREAPKKWQGGFNFTYHLGPGFNNNNKAHIKLRVKINNQLVNKTIQNVIGYIKGKVEPDRYVIIGNHRDAWVRGAVDSAGGTGAFLELSRVFGDLLKNGWRPRRTILFCSWGAEEFNLIGSTEWIEEHMKILHGRAVAYINSDIIVVGNGSLSVAASPLLYHAIFNATKEVPNPNNEEEAKTVYDKWLISFPLMRNSSDMLFSPEFRNVMDKSYDYESDLNTLNRRAHFKNVEVGESGSILKSYMESAMQEVRPKVRQLDMRSAYAPFFTVAGIPAVDITYTNINDQKVDAYTMPLLHTQYDDIKLIEKFIDSENFKYHKAVTQVLGELIRDLADSLFLPFNLLDYAQVLKDFYLTLHIHTEHILLSHGLDISLLDSSIQNFTTAAIKFHSVQDKLDLTDPMSIRRINDQLLLLERAFLDQNGLPRNVMKRHIVLSPSETNPPYDEMFPGLMDEFTLLLQQADVKNTWSWDVIKAHFSILVFTIQSAAETISDVV